MAYFFFSGLSGAYVLLALGVVISAVDIARVHSSWGRRLVPGFILSLVREREQKSISAITHFIIAATLVDFLYLFGGLSKDFVLAAVMYVSFADPVARLIGKTFGRGNLFNTGKTLAGSVSFFIIGTAMAYVACTAFGAKFTWIQLLIGGMIATGIELFSGGWDNFTIPFFTTLAMWALYPT
jgi:dolichol kinase